MTPPLLLKDALLKGLFFNHNSCCFLAVVYCIIGKHALLHLAQTYRFSFCWGMQYKKNTLAEQAGFGIWTVRNLLTNSLLSCVTNVALFALDEQ